MQSVLSETTRLTEWACLCELIRVFIIQSGNYDELLEQDGAFAEFLRNYAVTDEDAMQEGDPTGKITNLWGLWKLVIILPVSRIVTSCLWKINSQAFAKSVMITVYLLSELSTVSPHYI